MENMESSKEKKRLFSEDIEAYKTTEIPKTKEELNEMKKLLEFKKKANEEININEKSKTELINHMEKFMEDGLKVQKWELTPKKFFEKIVSDKNYYTNENIYLNSKLFNDYKNFFIRYTNLNESVKHIDTQYKNWWKFQIDIYFERTQPLLTKWLTEIEEKVSWKKQNLYKISYDVWFYIRD